VFAIAGASAEPARPLMAPSVRAVALDPARYADQTVTLTGRFRGRNLYGDLPEAPGKSRWDFVLQSAEDLDPMARVDTGKWLEVSGTVRTQGAATWVEGEKLQLSTAEDTTPAAVVSVAAPPPTPEEVFSAPLSEETEVPTDVVVRIQFSRDMDRRTFADHVRVSYVPGPGAPPVASPPTFTSMYRDDTRSLEIKFSTPLERFRTVRVDLLDGIVALGGGNLAPWALTFSIGASPPPSTERP
jgi:hypothetical protein